MKISIFTSPELMERPTSDTRYLHDSIAPHFEVTVHHDPDPALARDADVVFARYPHPGIGSLTQALVNYDDKLVINDPRAVMDYGTKRTLLRFPELTPPTRIGASAADLRDFASTHGTLVLKPVDGHKGTGVRKLHAARMTEDELDEEIAAFTAEYGTPVVQPFLRLVEEVGDKRINIFGFEAISAVRTMPRPGSFICHESSGGHAVAAEITESDERIIEAVVPFLRELGIWWTGIDVIGPYLGEVNIRSPAMVERADRAHGNSQGREIFVRKLAAYARDHGL